LLSFIVIFTDNIIDEDSKLRNAWDWHLAEVKCELHICVGDAIVLF